MTRLADTAADQADQAMHDRLEVELMRRGLAETCSELQVLAGIPSVSWR